MPIENDIKSIFSHKSILDNFFNFKKMSTALQGGLQSAHNAKKIKACAHYKIVMSYINQESTRLMCLVDIQI